MYYQLIIFIGQCKNQEMPLCIKYLHRKGIEVRDGSSKKKKTKKKKKKKKTTRSNFLVEELIFERSSRHNFFLGDIKIFIF